MGTNPNLRVLVSSAIELDTDTVLDVGAGKGKRTSHLKNPVTLLDAWKDYNPDIVHDLAVADLPFADRSYDTVVFIDVIEHFTKERGFEVLKDLQRVANKSLFLLTPLNWFDNIHSIKDPKLWSYGNPFQEHHSLWGVEDFPEADGWTQHVFPGYYCGTWRR